jgi:hypothetical protein
MLRVVADPPNGRWAFQKLLVDEDRDIEFAPLGTIAMGSITVFRLRWGSKVIPVSVSGRGPEDPKSEEGYIFTRIDLNGAGVTAAYPVEPYPFLSAAERNEAMSIAIECTLVFGEFADGLSAASTKYSFAYDGRRLYRSDFGY